VGWAASSIADITIRRPVRRGITAEAAAELPEVKVSTIRAANLTFNTRREVENWIQTASAKDIFGLIALD
jgi:hypothetical protein